MIGERVEGCAVEFREFYAGEPHSMVRRRDAVTVTHIGRNAVRVEFLHKAPVVKRLTAKRISIVAPDGRDLVAAWKEEGPARRLRGWDRVRPPRAGLPTYAPMRTVPPGLHTEQQWQALGRRVRAECVGQPVGYGWRQPGVFHGWRYGGWLGLYTADQTAEIRRRLGGGARLPP